MAVVEADLPIAWRVCGTLFNITRFTVRSVDAKGCLPFCPVGVEQGWAGLVELFYG